MYTNMLQEVIKPRPWIECSQRKPKKEGWYAVQDYTVEGEYYMDAYWHQGSWWKFGRYANMLNVRIEMRDVLRWRFMGEIAREDIRRQCANAIIPRDPFQRVQVGFLRKLWLLYVMDKNKLTQKELAKELGTTGKNIGRIIDGVTLLGVEFATDRLERLYVLNWGAISQQWVHENAEAIAVAIQETLGMHGNELAESRDFQALTRQDTALDAG